MVYILSQHGRFVWSLANAIATYLQYVYTMTDHTCAASSNCHQTFLKYSRRQVAKIVNISCKRREAIAYCSTSCVDYYHCSISDKYRGVAPFQVSSNMLVCLGDGSAQTILRAATLRQKLHIKLPIPPSHSILTQGQTVPALTLSSQAPGRVATGVPIFNSLVWLDPEKSRRKRDSNPVSSALEADASTITPTRRYHQRKWSASRHHHTPPRQQAARPLECRRPRVRLQASDLRNLQCSGYQFRRLAMWDRC